MTWMVRGRRKKALTDSPCWNGPRWVTYSIGAVPSAPSSWMMNVGGANEYCCPFGAMYRARSPISTLSSLGQCYQCSHIHFHRCWRLVVLVVGVNVEFIVGRRGRLALHSTHDRRHLCA